MRRADYGRPGIPLNDLPIPVPIPFRGWYTSPHVSARPRAALPYRDRTARITQPDAKGLPYDTPEDLGNDSYSAANASGNRNENDGRQLQTTLSAASSTQSEHGLALVLPLTSRRPARQMTKYDDLSSPSRPPPPVSRRRKRSPVSRSSEHDKMTLDERIRYRYRTDGATLISVSASAAAQHTERPQSPIGEMWTRYTRPSDHWSPPACTFPPSFVPRHDGDHWSPPSSPRSGRASRRRSHKAGDGDARTAAHSHRSPSPRSPAALRFIRQPRPPSSSPPPLTPPPPPSVKDSDADEEGYGDDLSPPRRRRRLLRGGLDQSQSSRRGSETTG